MKFPKHLRRELPNGRVLKTDTILNDLNIHTVCSEALCPNQFECFSKKCATFLACGSICTRSCAFCNIKHSKTPPPLDENEISNIALAAKRLELKHIVITMVTRDDLEDGGALHLSKIINEVKKQNSNSTIEVLTSDFSNKLNLIDLVLDCKVDIFNYNIETVKSLTPKIRNIATYKNSLNLLKYVNETKKAHFIKSGFMVGLGETKAEVFETIKDLKTNGCDIITIGQYLAPNKKKIPVKEFISPTIFKEYENYGKSLNIKYIHANSYVRSSYNSELIINKLIKFS